MNLPDKRILYRQKGWIITKNPRGRLVHYHKDMPMRVTDGKQLTCKYCAVEVPKKVATLARLFEASWG